MPSHSGHTNSFSKRGCRTHRWTLVLNNCGLTLLRVAGLGKAWACLPGSPSFTAAALRRSRVLVSSAADNTRWRGGPLQSLSPLSPVGGVAVVVVGAGAGALAGAAAVGAAGACAAVNCATVDAGAAGAEAGNVVCAGASACSALAVLLELVLRLL
eukprot:7243144-Karenia_brevis.AAC.1